MHPVRKGNAELYSNLGRLKEVFAKIIDFFQTPLTPPILLGIEVR